MSVHVYLAPAASGKTAYVLDLVREAARGLQCTPRVCLPTRVQIRAWRRRLARDGGAMGVRLLTFDRLYAECLSSAREAYTELSEPVQYRLIRAIVDSAVLSHYAPLRDRPGFIHVLQRLIREWKAARIWPHELLKAIAALGDEPRLRELALIYAAYQERLQQQGWADRAGLGWLAVEALEQRAPQVAHDWPLLVVDGFDNITSVQMAMLQVLAKRVDHLIITLTGSADGSERPLVHRRFKETRRRLEGALEVAAEPLPTTTSHHAAALAHLEQNLYRSDVDKIDAGECIELLAAPDRTAEVREALRWLKQRLILDQMDRGDVALLARSILPYQPFILQIASEFGLPIRVVGGFRLRDNPAIAALLSLLQLMLPLSDDDPQPTLSRRMVVESWRSPYFDWSTQPAKGVSERIGIEAGDAEALDVLARAGRVIQGLAQWQDMWNDVGGTIPPGSMDLPDEADGTSAASLQVKFQRFVQRLTPPAGEHRYRDFVAWLEELIGSDPTSGSARYSIPEEPTSLMMIHRVRQADDTVAERDTVALGTLKDVLRGLVWAEEALESDDRVDFARFFSELTGAIDATRFNLPANPAREVILVADVGQARGVPFRAVAVLGLAEGEFPAGLSEDPFLRDADRQQLRDSSDLALEPSVESAEVEYFYETITRARERLLLTRPRLSDSGALWQPSPFWEEVQHLVDVQVEALTTESRPTPDRAMSWPELMESLASHHGYGKVHNWAQQEEPHRGDDVARAARVLRLRAMHDESHFDGALDSLSRDLSKEFGPERTWSASRLESYRACPFMFFVRSVLGLEPREEPQEDLDSRQLGIIYHRILEQVYQAPGITDPTNLDQLLAALPGVAKYILDGAPEKEGFRETAWWEQTRQEIVDNVALSLAALDELRVELDQQFQADFVPRCHEARFFGSHALTVTDDQDQFRLHGVIDRVDQSSNGRLLIIDYKTGGATQHTNPSVARGEKLQLPLYALAARDGLELGEPVEGFYWHILQCEKSRFTLSGFAKKEARNAIDVALEYAWETVRQVRQGHFAPESPDAGCPSYCPAAAFCWHYRPGYGG